MFERQSDNVTVQSYYEYYNGNYFMYYEAGEVELRQYNIKAFYGIDNGGLLMSTYGEFKNNQGSKNLLKDMYSDFTYSDGYYTADLTWATYADMSGNVKIAIKNKTLSKAIYHYVGTSRGYSYDIKYEVDFLNVNSTTVEVPQNVRKAIDDEKTKLQ